MDPSTTQSTTNTYVFEHPTLGSMKGLISPETPNVVRFRAIPYATLPGRFKQSVLQEKLDGHSRDFTNPGYACPHTFDMEDIHSGGLYPGQETIKMSEFDSLILDVNVPRSHLESLNKASTEYLPVMAYIHGGGFVLGKIDAQHNTAHMVQHSLTISKAVVAVAIQYRLGALGFMATPDGGKNFALWDQRNALLWIQKFIGGFGGNKGRVTLFGESAGAYSICCHMLSHRPPYPLEPLFRRVIIMSGVMGPMLSPISEKDAAKAFDTMCKSQGISERDQTALEKLRTLDLHSIVSASEAWSSQGNMWSPVEDSAFFRTNITWDKVPELLGSCEWVDNMIVGNTGFEGLAGLSDARLMTPKSFQDHLRRELSDEAAKEVMEAYHVTLEMDQNLFLTPAMRWCGDIIFDAPIHALTKHMSTKAGKNIFRYVFNIRNPFPSAPFFQQAHHWVDVYFLFRSMQFRFPHQYLKDISDKHAALWIAFVNGEKPWSEFEDRDEGVIMVADEQEGWVEKTLPEYEIMSRVEWSRLERLYDAWDEKKGERWRPLDLIALKEAKG